MAMSSSKPMTLTVCQVVAYPPLDEDHEYNSREIYLLANDISYPPTKEIMDDVASCDEDIDQMEVVFIHWYMESRNKDQEKLQSIEYVIGDSLMEQAQPPHMEDCDDDDKEV